MSRQSSHKLSPKVTQNLQEALDSQKALVLSWTAKDCEHSQEMADTVWKDPDVAAWLSEYAVLTELDVDDERDQALSFSIRGTPTVLLVRDGEVFDRAEGSLSPGEMLEFLDGARTGLNTLARLDESVDERAAEYLNARLQRFRQRVDQGQYDLALEEGLWLWTHMADLAPALMGVRMSFFLGDLQSLVAQSRKAMKVFVALRDGLEKQVRKKDCSLEIVQDWVALNELTTPSSKLLERYLELLKLPGVGHHFWGRRPLLIEALWRRKFYVEAGEAVEDALEHGRFALGLPSREDDPPDEHPDPPSDEQWPEVADYVARLYAGALAAGRDDVAEALVDAALACAKGPDLLHRFVQRSYEADVLRAEHLGWVAEGESKLKAAVEKVLAPKVEVKAPKRTSKRARG